MSLRRVRTRPSACARASAPSTASASVKSLPAHSVNKKGGTDALILTKTNARSTVHRPGYMDYIGVLDFDAKGKAIGEVCAQTLFKEGRAAAAAVAAHARNDSLETVVEANTLLSGLGFESGGLAAAHGIAQSYTAIPKVHAGYLHGEMVAMGTLAHLVIEERPDEARKVAEFFAAVGLPVHLGQLALDASDTRALDVVSEGALRFPFVHNMLRPITAAVVRAAVLDAHDLGRSVAQDVGDEAYRRLHA